MHSFIFSNSDCHLEEKFPRVLSFTGSVSDPDSEIRGWPGLRKKFFRPFGPQFGLKIGTLRYEDGELGRRRGWMGKTRSSPVVHAKNKILKIKQFSLGTATAIFLSQTNMSTFKDARTVLLESYLDGVIDDDKFILLCDETLKKPKFPYEFFFYFYLK